MPEDHKAKWFAGSALNTGEQAMQSVLSTVLSRLNAFIDSEIEQILCFETAIDIEKFCSEKSAIFLVMPEEDNTKHFLISLCFKLIFRDIIDKIKYKKSIYTKSKKSRGDLNERIYIKFRHTNKS